MKTRFAAVVALGLALSMAVHAAPRDIAARAEVEAKLARIAEASRGTLGVSALHLKTGERLQLNAGERYPMASTFKIAIALKVLDQVDRGAMSLEQKIAIDGGNLSPGSGELKSTEPDVERASPVGHLLGIMMRNSDNTATDYLLAGVGGPKAVTQYVHAMGIADFEVSRSAAQLVADSWAFKLPPPGQRTARNLVRAQSTVPDAKRQEGAAKVLADRRDTTTPDAMVSILEKLQSGKAVSAASTKLLLDIMEGCKTGPRRLRGELPRGAVVAHKTGTLTRVATNDVGIVELPWRGGHFVIAVYLKGSPYPIATQERTIAAAAITVYDYFTR